MYKGCYNFEEIDGIWIIQELIPEGIPETKPLDATYGPITIEPERFARRVQLGSMETETFAWPYMNWLELHGAVKMNVSHFINGIYRNGVPHRYNSKIAGARQFGDDTGKSCFDNCPVCGGELGYYMCRANCDIMRMVNDMLAGLQMLWVQGSMHQEGSLSERFCWPSQLFVDRLCKPHNPVTDTIVQSHAQPLPTS